MNSENRTISISVPAELDKEIIAVCGTNDSEMIRNLIIRGLNARKDQEGA